MPYRDGTGPMGTGAGTGRGMGGCFGTNATANAAPFGMGMGMRRGRGCNRGCGYRNFAAQPGAQTRRAMLVDQKQMIEQQLAAINKSLESENE